MVIELIFFILSTLLFLMSFLPLINNKHWLFRVWVYAKIQIIFLLLFTILLGFFGVNHKTYIFYIFLFINLFFIVYHSFLLFEFTPAYRWFSKKEKIKGYLTNTIDIISANVYQYNDETYHLIDLINKRKPDIFITYESNQKWENAMSVFDKTYPHHIKIAQENTYGMHLYSTIPFEYKKTHYFVSEDIPCIEIEIKIENQKLRLFAVHPPPPSPTEEETSKERDGELMAIAKYIRENNFNNVLVIGDFNNVAWSKSSKRFRRLTALNDPRVGRGLIPTFHAKYYLLRVPIDLLFHSTTIVIKDIKTVEPINSDHFPLYFSFQISSNEEDEVQSKKECNDEIDMEKDIQEGKEEKGDR